MKQKIKIAGSNVHDLLFKGFLVRLAFDAMLDKFFIEPISQKDTVDEQQILTLRVEDDRDQIKHFMDALESKDYNTDEEQLRYWGFEMEKRGKVQISKIEYLPFDDHVPDLVMEATLHNFELTGAFCNKEQKH